MKKHKNGTSIFPFVIGCLIVVAAWFLNIFFAEEIYGSLSNDGTTTINPLEGISSLFSGLAFAGIIYTVLLQRKELQLQRQELQETRAELKRSADAQEKSESIMNQTAQLNGWSSLLNLYQEEYVRAYPGQKDRHHQRRVEARDKIESILSKLGSENTGSHTK